MAKMLKYVDNDDIMTTKVDDTVNFMFESPGKIYDFEITLLVIDCQQYWMFEEAEYDATVKVASSELAMVYRDLSSIGGIGTGMMRMMHDFFRIGVTTDLPYGWEGSIDYYGRSYIFFMLARAAAALLAHTAVARSRHLRFGSGRIYLIFILMFNILMFDYVRKGRKKYLGLIVTNI